MEIVDLDPVCNKRKAEVDNSDDTHENKKIKIEDLDPVCNKRKAEVDNSDDTHENKKIKIGDLDPVCNERKAEVDNSDDTHENKKIKTEDSDQNISSVDAEQVLNEDASKDNSEILFNGVELSKLTKRQLKKYNKMLKWQEVKKLKRAKEREKTKQKKIEAKKNNIDLGPSRKALKRSTMAKSSCKVSVIIDLSFDDLMISKDLGKVIKQVLRVYTENRRSKNPMQLHLTSFEGKAKEEMEKHNGYEHWDINFHDDEYIKIFPKEKLVYLTSESENVINKLDDDKIYIIGGLVDHNTHKGICYKKAVDQGIDHGQLPIREYFWMKHRKVFTINQVFEILLRVVEGKTFKEAFESTLPKRINMQPAKLKTHTNKEEDLSKSPNIEEVKS